MPDDLEGFDPAPAGQLGVERDGALHDADGEIGVHGRGGVVFLVAPAEEGAAAWSPRGGDGVRQRREEGGWLDGERDDDLIFTGGEKEGRRGKVGRRKIQETDVPAARCIR